METTTTIPGQPTSKRRVCYYLPTEVIADLEGLKKAHRVNLSVFVESAIRDSLRRHARRKPTKPAA
jgi:post-segregation antitoxin (ccd killing protein)